MVPAPPPRFMRMPSLINDDEFIANAMRGFPAMNFVNPEISYEVFRTYALRGPLINGHIFPVSDSLLVFLKSMPLAFLNNY